ncbi:MAG TPA: hypothetical protein VNK05_06675, partial [Chloroflexota bacterium]|nr:hypothetical protein [Chloroflexota bacterium]
GQRGRPRTRGDRLPTPAALATARTAHGTWHRLRLVLYGKTVTPLVFRGTALWYGALRAQPIRFVVVRDPSGRRRDETFFCTDLAVGAAFLLTTYAKRWSLEVTFFDCKQALGFEDPQNQAARAVRRTAPFVGLVYALVVLRAVGRAAGAPRGALRVAAPPLVPPQARSGVPRPARRRPPGWPQSGRPRQRRHFARTLPATAPAICPFPSWAYQSLLSIRAQLEPRRCLPA